MVAQLEPKVLVRSQTDPLSQKWDLKPMRLECASSILSQYLQNRKTPLLMLLTLVIAVEQPMISSFQPSDWRRAMVLAVAEQIVALAIAQNQNCQKHHSNQPSPRRDSVAEEVVAVTKSRDYSHVGLEVVV